MMKKTRELPPTKEVPLLETIETEKINFEFLKHRRLRRWYRVYWITVGLIVLLCFALLFSEIGLGWIRFPTWQSSASKPSGSTSKKPTVGTLLPSYQNKDEEPSTKPQNPTPPTDTEKSPLTWETLYSFDASAVPSGQLPIVPMDLSLSSYGTSYIHNDTGLVPDTKALLKKSWEPSVSIEPLSTVSAPKVLIVHTHGTEAYSEDGAISYAESETELTRSGDIHKNVVAVGTLISDYLNQNGIATVHCTVMHDQVQYKDSYARAEETVKEYLQMYPSIRLVIDVHRDSIVKSSGEMVRPVTLVNGEAAAQLMCVVGSNWGGDEHPNWERNLALALQIRERLNLQYENLCRPVYLRSSTYNQELAPYSLLLEVGAGGNSLAEAARSALLFAQAISHYIPKL